MLLVHTFFYGSAFFIALLAYRAFFLTEENGGVFFPDNILTCLRNSMICLLIIFLLNLTSLSESIFDYGLLSFAIDVFRLDAFDMVDVTRFKRSGLTFFLSVFLFFFLIEAAHILFVGIKDRE